MSELYEYKNALEIHDNKCKLHNIPLEVEMDQVDMNEVAYYPYCPLCSMIETIELHANEIHKQMKWLDEDEVTVEEMDDISKEFEGIEDPKIDEEKEIDIEKLTQTVKKYNDPFQEKKGKVIDYLRTFFTNIKQDYMIQLIDGGGKLNYEFITDFADPVLKINIEFPDVFWHNEGFFDLTRDQKMESYGWKVIRINGNSPSPEKMSRVISQSL